MICGRDAAVMKPRREKGAVFVSQMTSDVRSVSAFIGMFLRCFFAGRIQQGLPDLWQVTSLRGQRIKCAKKGE